MDDMQAYMDVMTDIFADLPSQGPGSSQTTQHVLSLCPPLAPSAIVLDVGSGTGRQAFALAESLPNQTVFAFDLLYAFVHQLKQQAKGYNIVPIRADMNHFPFALGSIDLIWAEASAYSIGFENALRAWHKFLKPDGCLAVSELVWLKSDVSDELQQFWAEEYPDMRHVDIFPSLFADCGYVVVDETNLSEGDWWEYYKPLEAKLPAMREKYQANEMAQGIIDNIATEIDMFRQYMDCYGYRFFILQKA